MTDLSTTIVAKSDQKNAVDLIGGAITVKITKVKLTADEQQPVIIDYEGSDGKPYKPCLSMRRVLISKWGSDGDKYVGRMLTLYNDEKVTWAGQSVGGIRISHMSDIDKDFTISLAKAKGSYMPYKIKKLVTVPLKELAEADFRDFEEKIIEAETMAELQIVGAEIKESGYDADGTKKIKAVYSKAMKALRGDDK